MTSESFDPVEFKAEQRRQWSESAEGWMKWSETIEAALHPVTERMLSTAGIGPGHKVLDVATGIGEPALTAARIVAPSGRVVAIDQSPRMLEIARERAAASGMGNIEFREMDAESLEMPSGSFDAVLCRFGLMFLPDLPSALIGLRSLLTAGGRFAAAVWSEASKVPFISVPGEVIGRAGELPGSPEGTPGPFSLADTSALEQALRQAGFADVSSELVEVNWVVPSAEVFVTALQDIAPPVKALLGRLPEKGRSDIVRDLKEAMGRYAMEDGSLHIPNEAVCVAGRRP